MHKLLLAFLISILSVSSLFAQVPDWFIKHENLNNTNLFGYGSARTLSGAKKQAMADLAGFIYSSVSSQTQSSQSVKRSEELKTSSSFSQSIKTSSGDISLSGTKISNSQKIEKLYYVQVQVDGSKLAQSQLAIIENANEKLAKALGKLDPTSLEDSLELARLDPDISASAQAYTLLGRLANISPLFFDNDHKDKLQKEQEAQVEKSKQQLSKLSIKLSLKNTELSPFLSSSKQMLAQAEIKLIETKPTHPLSAELVIDGEVNLEDFHGALLAFINLSFNLINYKGEKIQVKNDSLKQLSPFAKAKTIQQAATKWQAEISQKTGLINYLNN